MSTGREILGNYSTADALYVPSKVKTSRVIPFDQFSDFMRFGPPQQPQVYDANITYAKCIDDGNRPANHVGDWPVAGQWYMTRPVGSMADGVVGIRILEFEGDAPYFNSFGVHRFDLQGWLPFQCLN